MTHPDEPRWPNQPSVRAALVVAAVTMVAIGAGGALSGISHGAYHDFEQFYWAAVAMRDGADLASGRSGGYVYPPLLAFALMPLAALPLKTAAIAWLGINLLIAIAAASLAAGEAARRVGLAASTWLTLGIAAAGSLIVADKARSSLDQGQSDMLMVMAFVLGLRWLGKRDWAAGGVLGLAANIKYASLVVLPYLMLRRRWRAAGWMVAWTIALSLLPAVYRGWQRNLDDLGAALTMLSHIEPRDAAHSHLAPIGRQRAVSITSAVAGWLRGTGDGGARGPIVVAAIASIVGAVVLAAWLIYRRRGIPLLRLRADRAGISGAPAWDGPRPGWAPRVEALEWSGLIVGVLAFSPPTEGRHMVMLLPVTCLAAAVLMTQRSLARSAPLVVGLAVLWLGLTLPPGGEKFRGAVDAWRSAAGPSWCMLAMYLTLLWTGLPDARTAATAEAPATPSS